MTEKREGILKSNHLHVWVNTLLGKLFISVMFTRSYFLNALLIILDQSQILYCTSEKMVQLIEIAPVPIHYKPGRLKIQSRSGEIISKQKVELRNRFRSAI